MLLSLLIALPLAGLLATVLVGRVRPTAARWTALLAALGEVALCVAAADAWYAGQPAPLVESFAADVRFTFWSLSLDGLSLPLVGLTVVLTVVAVLASWRVEHNPGAHHALLLGLQAATVAVFLAEDLVLFYVAWEAVLIPMFFLIGKWGHERRRHAAMKFFLYTFAGSALMLVGILLVLSHTGQSGITAAVQTGLPPGAGGLIFWLIAAGLLVKVPVVPLHTWLPDAHVEAPTAGSIMLAGVLLKMGGYGLIRLAAPLAPQAFQDAAPVLAALGMVGIAYGALVAMAQTDLKRLVAYGSVAHMGFVVLAVSVATPAAFSAAMLAMVSHGFISALLFLLVGALYERTHTRRIARFGGLMRTMPTWGVAFSFGALASLGLPGLSGFPGELVTMLEAYGAWGWWIVVPGVGLAVSAAYHLWAVRRVNHGPVVEEWAGLTDLGLDERLAVLPLVAGIVAVGVWPAIVTTVSDPVMRSLAFLAGGGA